MAEGSYFMAASMIASFSTIIITINYITTPSAVNSSLFLPTIAEVA